MHLIDPKPHVPKLVSNRTADQISIMFNGIAHRYDLLNRILSANTDQRWRKLTSQLILKTSPKKVLDLATGTADLAIRLATMNSTVHVIGVDIAAKMLENGNFKIAQKGFQNRITLKEGNALDIPLNDESVDAVTIAFGIRNVSNYQKALLEMYRVLKPQGTIAILEFSLPTFSLVRAAYLFYFRYLLPFVGGIISGNSYAYSYLNRSVESFLNEKQFKKVVINCGFSQCRTIKLTYGIASIYIAKKPRD